MDRLDVLLYGLTAGVLERKSSGALRFTYLRSWLDEPGAVPLSLSMPLRIEPYAGPEVLNFLDNLLPDSGDVRDRWAAEAGLPSTDPFLLLAEYGQDAAGALQFLRPAPEAIASARRATSDHEIASRIRAIRDDDTSWRGTESGYFSLGGAQGKFSLGLDANEWYEPSGEFPTTHIFKPRVRGVRDGELIEHLTMGAAHNVGLNAATTVIGEFEGEHSLIVKRFDRVEYSDGTVIRTHQEDLAQSLGISRLQKYEARGGPGYRAILDLLDREGGAAAQESQEAFVRALVFSWIMLNTDGHAKNHSVSIHREGALLTPLYDVSSLIPYAGRDEDSPAQLAGAFSSAQLSMRIAADYEVGEQSWFEWKAVAREAGVERVGLTDWALAVADSLPEILAGLAGSLPTHLQTDTVARFVERMPIRSEQVLREIQK